MTALWQFKESLKREGVSVADHLNNTHTVLFRQNKQKNNPLDYVTIFHDANSGIEPGETLTLGDKAFLVLSCETPENTGYQRSDCALCNATVSLCVTEKGVDDKFDVIIVAVPFAENVPIFVENATDSVIWNDSPNDFRLIIPARFGLVLDNIIETVALKQLSNKSFISSPLYYRPTAIDYSKMSVSGSARSGLLFVTATSTNSIE